MLSLAGGPPAQPERWYRSVIRNLAWNRWSRRSDLVTEGEWFELVESPHQGPLELAEASQRRRQLERALQTIPEIYREILGARYLQSCGLSEICTRLDISYETARTRLRRGLALLRKRMREGGPLEVADRGKASRIHSNR